MLEPKRLKLNYEPGDTLQTILAAQGVFFPHPCGGRGACGQCRVRFIEGAPEPTLVEKKHLTEAQLAQGIRLSCACRPEGNAVVELLGAEQNQFVFELGQEAALPVTIESEVRKLSLQLQLPTLEEQGDCLSRIVGQLLLNGVDFETLGPQIPPALLASIPAAVQAGQRLVTVTFDHEGLVEIEPGDTREQLYGIAIDIGTTTLAARLIDLNTGERLAWTARLNSQSSLGADVVNRIEYSRKNHGGLQALQHRVLSDLHAMVEEALQEAGVAARHIGQIALVGNPTMTHLLLGVDPLSIALSPYIPVWTRSLRLPADRLGFHLASGCKALIGPAASAYLGSDVLAGVVACGMDLDEEVSLLIDVGTNGEMVLGNKDRMVGASTAAGPAFEGAQISCGIWAAPGAIDRVSFDGAVRIHALQDKPPIGICGTGLVDVTAELLRAGAVTPAGKMRGPSEIDGLPTSVAARIRSIQGQAAFYLAGSEKAPLCLTARDIRQVQLAKGAIQAGVAILAEEMGVAVEAIDRIYLAGSFGQKLCVPNLQRLGLLQRCDPARIQAVGNSALAGAQLMLLSREYNRRLEQLHHTIRYVELSSHPVFTEAFTEAMLFPEE